MIEIKRFKSAFQRPHLDIGGRANWLREKCGEFSHNFRSCFLGEDQTGLTFQTAGAEVSSGIIRSPHTERPAAPLKISINTGRILYDRQKRKRVAEETNPVTTTDQIQKPPSPIDRIESFTNQYLEEITSIEESTAAKKELLMGETGVWIEEFEEISKEAKIKREEADRRATAASVWLEVYGPKYNKPRSTYLTALKETCRGTLECVQDGARTLKDCINENAITKGLPLASKLRNAKMLATLGVVAAFGVATLLSSADANTLNDIRNLLPNLDLSFLGDLSSLGSIFDKGSDLVNNGLDISQVDVSQTDPTSVTGQVDISSGIPGQEGFSQDYNPWDYQGPDKSFISSDPAPSVDLTADTIPSVDTTPVADTTFQQVDTPPADILVYTPSPLLDQIQLGQPIDPQIRDLAESMQGNLNDNVEKLYRDFYVQSQDNFKITVDTILDKPDQFSAYTNQVAQTQRDAINLVDQQLKEGITPSLNLIQKAMHYSHPV